MGRGGGGLVVLPQKIFENGNWETCSRGPCETQQNLYSLHAVGGPFSTSYPLKLIKSLNVKSEESSITRLTIFGRKKYKKIFTPEKSIKSTFSLKKYKVYKSGSTALCMNRFLHIFQGLIQHLIHIIELYKHTTPWHPSLSSIGFHTQKSHQLIEVSLIISASSINLFWLLVGSLLINKRWLKDAPMKNNLFSFAQSISADAMWPYEMRNLDCHNYCKQFINIVRVQRWADFRRLAETVQAHTAYSI